MEDILEISCGLDVHKESVVACIIATNKDVTGKKKNPLIVETKIFKTLLDDLNHLKKWIESHNCHDVAMESTGVYWCPVYEVLETAFEGNINLLVVNARHMRNIPGKKSDIKDAQWISSLLRAGLLRGSFIPEPEVRHLREIARYRKNIVYDINSQKNRVEKYLQIKGFKLSTFLSDVFGVSGRNLLDILISTGTITPEDVRDSLRGTAKRKTDEMLYALNGRMNQESCDHLKRMLNLLDDLNEHLALVEKDIDQASTKFMPQIQLLQTIPGIGDTAAKAIIGEIGIDMETFPTAAHFCSWAGLSPGENESAGKKKVPAQSLATHI